MEPVSPRMCELTAEQVRRRTDPTKFTFATTAELPEPERLVGQIRAEEAIEFALEMTTERYNLYVSGQPGSGRLTSTLKAVERIAASQPSGSDWLYVYHFERPAEPLAINLPAGRGQQFAHDVEAFVAACRRELRRVFRGEAYSQQRDAILKEVGARHTRVIEQLEQDGLSHGFLVQGTPNGIAMVPVKRIESAPPLGEGDGQAAEVASPGFEPLSPQEFAALPQAEQERMRAEQELVADAISHALPQLQALEAEARERIHELNRDVAHSAMERLTEELVVLYHDSPPVADYLRHVESDIVAHVDVLGMTPDEAGHDDNGGAGQQAVPDSEPDDAETGQPPTDDAATGEGLLLQEDMRERPAVAALLRRYRVNVLVAHKADDHAPVVQELNPTYPNLLGHVEFGLHEGLPFTDHLMIKAGAFHQANGGYLILQARELLNHPLAWNALKRALRFGVIGIESDGELENMPASASLRPEAIPLQMKVILIGDPEINEALLLLDPEFSELFAVRADFDVDAPRTAETERFYAEFAGQAARAAKLPGLAPEAVASIIEEGSRWAEDQDKLSTRLRSLSQLVVEAGHLARRENAPVTTRAHVADAIAARERRMSLVSDKLDELIDQRTIMIDTDGAIVGQVNGLSVTSVSGYAFGKPARITARTSPGLAGIVNLERETLMSGPVHSKGILILGGYLAGRYAHEYPLSLAGSLCFEQTYGEIEGDSASSAELYALLSSLSGLPLKQSLAVTGSVNQRGEVQPVGAVSDKIEGFFALCRRRGLTGEQGVIIPRANVRNLMLRDEVVEAIRAGQFHIHAVSTIDEGIALLTGVSAGQEAADGGFAEDTVNELVSRQLRLYSERMRAFGPAPAPLLR